MVDFADVGLNDSSSWVRGANISDRYKDKFQIPRTKFPWPGRQTMSNDQ